MNIWQKLFGGGQQASGQQSQSGQYWEKDNKGTRQETESKATSYWIARNAQQKFDPFALYVFDQETNARDALLELGCMHLARDSGKIICTETLVFGYYKRENDGKYEAIVCGEDLSHEVYETARTSFIKHGGVKRNEQEPEMAKKPKSSPTQSAAIKISFVREDRRQQMGHAMVYRIHKGPDAASAKAFLEQNPVTRPLYYIVVETPEGNYCRDKDGIYKE
jgi:hypothetical protein